MSCRKTTLAAVLTTLIIGSAFAENSGSQVHVQRLVEQIPIGQLGKPLGTMLIVEGEYQVREPKNPRAKLMPPSTTLLITSVDGKRLPKTVLYPFSETVLFLAVKPVDGSRFRLRGYETGGFYGLVEGELDLQRDDVARAIPSPFKFELRFNVLKDELKNLSERDAARLPYPK